MVRGYEEVSSSQAGHRTVTPRETPTASSLVDAMSIEELRLYSQVHAEIILEMSDNPTTSTIREAYNVIYFTQEKFVAGLRFLISSLVKRFLHFTRASPALVQLNVFRILTGCSVLKSV